MLFFFFFFPCPRIIHSTSEKSKSSPFPRARGRENKRDRQVTTGQQREKQSWRGVEVFILASRGLTVIYWEFDPLSSPHSFSRRASTPPPPPRRPLPLRPRRTNKSFVDPGGGGMADRQARGRGKARTPKREKQRGGRVVEWDESEDRLLSDTGRACKLIERRRRRVDCVHTLCARSCPIQCGCFVSSI